MISPEVFLQQLGLSAKETQVYLALLKRGPSSVRHLAEAAQVNRGTTYDILKSLQQQGLVSYYDQEKKTYFVAQDPESLSQIIADRKQSLESLDQQLEGVVPQLKSVANATSASKPVVRYYHGPKGVRNILREVLEDVASLSKKAYCVYSSSTIAKHLYDAIPNFTKLRIKAGLHVRVIAFGEGGSTKETLAERRWLSREKTASTYTIIFGRKTAFISLDDREQPHGVILEDANLSETQRLLFDAHWNSLT